MKSVENKQKFINEINYEINKVRSNPSCYIKVLEEYIKYYDGLILHKPWESVPIQTFEGIEAVKEGIQFLKIQPSLYQLILDFNLSHAAQDHSDDIGKNGLHGHMGSDQSDAEQRISKYLVYGSTIFENLDFGNSTAQDVIFSLIVDDGMDRKIQRSSIFSDNVKYMGVGVSDHIHYGTCVVLNFCGDILQYKNVPLEKNTELDYDDESTDENVIINKTYYERRNTLSQENEESLQNLEINSKEDSKNLTDDEIYNKNISSKENIGISNGNMENKNLKNSKINENTKIRMLDNKKLEDASLNLKTISVKQKRIIRKRNGKIVEKKLIKIFKLENGLEKIIEINEN